MVVDQASVLRAFVAICAVQTNWAGKIVLVHALDEKGAAIAMAATMAGAVTLAIEGDPERARAALRAGCCDFVVSTLDEALRTMKNEVRKGVALSVGLVGEDALLMQEIRERGVVPDFDAERTPLTESGFEILSFVAANLNERRAFDADLLQTADPVQARWLTAAPKFFPRDLKRSYWTA
ncbi:Urocanase [Terriglobus saanensis]|uniref:Urocanase n=1 Tax=Terriglobus saanensis (strain ATCC BAA-1853 / DSM 23119 / SP1PR4) TaxID=401053 RepID=E8V0U0_TERSS|nr:Urocanase [Terriglobus saanensis]ADV82231.1 Urocanase [Terriglobus saanensis SP1PR4]